MTNEENSTYANIFQAAIAMMEGLKSLDSLNRRGMEIIARPLVDVAANFIHESTGEPFEFNRDGMAEMLVHRYLTGKNFGVLGYRMELSKANETLRNPSELRNSGRVIQSDGSRIYSDGSRKLPINSGELPSELLDDWPARQPTKFEYRGFEDPERPDPIDSGTKQMGQTHINKLNEISPEIRQKLKEFCDRMVESGELKSKDF